MPPQWIYHLFVRKLRPPDIVNNAAYQGILYPESGIDPYISDFSQPNKYVNSRGSSLTLLLGEMQLLMKRVYGSNLFRVS